MPLWSWALVAVRSFLGVIYFTNGIAKIFAISSVRVGPWTQFLIDRDGARSILASNVHNEDAGLGPLRDFATGFVLPHWNVIGWVLAAAEVAVGVGLMFGILGRAAAAAGFAMALMVFLWSLGAGAWTYDYLYEPVLLAILMLTPRLPGVDTLLARRLRRGLEG